MTAGHLNCTVCPSCGAKLAAKDSRPHDAYGFATVRRRRVCDSCGYRVQTVEIPADVADDVFQEDAA
ncbi:NrdR family transcriptional regulator [Leisingera sp. NJS204]|uniref:NrdR family transcriptional regulator n=1 Tax=Leisingera sp. NJS204 TaxID=2508307 RepID=UPI001013980A|nr:hypothetical protein [Leisingera sp. NJS204]QAX31288.1 hypothetical protein ETW24_18955 [Leisingera sp. NJS204]